MDIQRDYIIKAKLHHLVFIIASILAIYLYIFIASNWNPICYIFIPLVIYSIYTFINSWHDVYIESNKLVFHKSIILNTKVLIPITNIKKCVIYYREYPRGDTSWMYIEDLNNEAGTFHIEPSNWEFQVLETKLKENNINYVRVYRNWNALKKIYNEQNVK
ncbi:MAG: hypothetical protein IPL31_00110 [Saprospiraceae bacterium]|nr:hypothetical protein [Saprospiraceae bacterium]